MASACRIGTIYFVIYGALLSRHFSQHRIASTVSFKNFGLSQVRSFEVLLHQVTHLVERKVMLSRGACLPKNIGIVLFA